jgi:3-hydroxyisobutyrate dehydrogenase-like beta-hydroxyacid dehydrogenase
MRIAFVGLGQMGGPTARRLLTTYRLPAVPMHSAQSAGSLDFVEALAFSAIINLFKPS